MKKDSLQSKSDVSRETLPKYYNGDKVMSLTDMNGAPPGIIAVVGNRTSGKSTYFLSRLLSYTQKTKRKVALLVRFKYELESAIEIFREPISFRFPLPFEQGKVNDMGYCTLNYDGKLFGYAIALNCADSLKKVSNLFKEVDYIYWDEFQSADNKYLTGEMEKFERIYTSVARAPYEMYRPVKVIAVSNAISMLCPLMSDLNIYGRLKKNTKFLRGDGFVFEQNMNESAENAKEKNTVLRAIKRNYADKELVYINDNTVNVYKLSGQNEYMFTMQVEGKSYGVRYYPSQNKIFVSKNVDRTCRNCYTEDTRNMCDMWNAFGNLSTFRNMFQKGNYVFENLGCREATIKFLKF